jgi:hypothetical protein
VWREQEHAEEVQTARDKTRARASLREQHGIDMLELYFRTVHQGGRMQFVHQRTGDTYSYDRTSDVWQKMGRNDG